MATPDTGANPAKIEDDVPQALIVEDGARPQSMRAPRRAPAPRRTAQPSAIVVPTRPRGIINSLQTVLLQPGAFFRTLPALSDTRQWVLVAALVLALVGFSAIRQRELREGGDSSIPTDVGIPTDIGVPSDGGFGGVPIDGGFGGPPPGVEPGAGVSAEADTSATWTTGIIAASGVVLGWLLLLPLLAIASLLRGRSPQFGKNWQIAIWASLPLGLMAALQLIYFSNGGQLGGSGVSGLLIELPELRTWSPLAQNLALSLGSHVTLFWLWSLALVYGGARHALGGRIWAAGIVLLLWVGVQVVLPVATGAVDAQTLLGEDSSGGGEMPIDGELPPDMGGMPPGMEFGGEIPPDAATTEDSFEFVPENGAPNIASTEEGQSPLESTPDLSAIDGAISIDGVQIIEVTSEAAPNAGADQP